MNGTLGKAMSTANQYVTVYTVPASAEYAAININAVNTGTTAAKLRVAITTQATTPAPEDHIEYGAALPANGGVYVCSCITVSAGDKIMIHSDSALVALRVSGLEQPIAQ